MIIRLSDEQATALEVKAAAQGLSVEQWIQKLAESDNKPPRENRTGAALQASPYRDIDIEPERYRLPVRDFSL
jgi:plasmid stability protein